MKHHDVKIEKWWKGDMVKVAMKKATGKTAFELGLMVEAQAKLLVPVRYGYLAASITTQAFDRGSPITAPGKYSSRTLPLWAHPPKGFRVIDKPTDPMNVHVGTPLSYAPHVEFGTRKMVAQPFLRVALALVKGQTLTIMRVNAKFFAAEFLTARDVFLQSMKRAA